MQRRSKLLGISSLVTLLILLAAPLVAQTGTVRCESRGNGRDQCKIDKGASVALTRHLSSTPCRENQNWGVTPNHIWVSGGCRAEFAVSAAAPAPPTPPTQEGVYASASQMRTCRTEADRRLPGYSYNDIQVTPEARQGTTAYMRWRAGSSGGTCTVAPSGRLLNFTMNAAGGGPGGPGGPGGTTVVARLTCESRRGDREECRAPDATDLRLVRQISQNPCRLNDTYGRGVGYIWVDKGCRAEFELTRAGNGGVVPVGPTRITCESGIKTRRECPIPTNSRVQLVGQLSSAPCRLDDTYGVGVDHIWVRGGCRGQFLVTQQGSSYRTVRLTCESRSVDRERCPVRGATAVQLVRQMSASACRLNESFGTGPGYIWTSKGCRGQFEVTIGGPTGGVTNPTTGLPENQGPDFGFRTLCESKGGERVECRIRQGERVELVKQLSTTACVRDRNWGTGPGYVWVNQGCRAEFTVH
jgi:hypothetical protein